jgi:ferric-dicitrate binding protein FerR (iron transport regulator)
VEYPDGSRIKLRAESTFKLAVPAETSGLKGGLLSLGGVFARVVKGQPGHFRVNTPTAVASVRGTEFFTAYGRPGEGGRDLWVCVGKGAIDLTASGSPETMVVKEGEGVLLPGGKRTTKAQRYEWTKSLNWTMDAGEGDLADAANLDSAYADLRDHDYR